MAKETELNPIPAQDAGAEGATEPLSARDECIALALASGQKRTKAAKLAACSARTVRRRMEDPAFRARVSELRLQMVERAVGALSRLGGEAATTLGRLMKESQPAGVQLGACRTVLMTVVSILEHVADVRQLSMVEELLREVKAKGGR